MLACFFSKPSTRTRVSLEAAAQRLGMLPLMLRPDELQLGRGEPISDTGRVLSGYVDAITIRTYAQSDVDELADDVPVINALTDDHHPCQALADLLTIQERFGDLEGCALPTSGTATTSPTRSWRRAPSPAWRWSRLRWLRAAGDPGGDARDARSRPLAAVRGAQIVYTTYGCRWARTPSEGTAGRAGAVPGLHRDHGRGVQGRDLHALPAGAPR